MTDNEMTENIEPALIDTASQAGKPTGHWSGRLANISAFMALVGFILIIVSSFFEFTPISAVSRPYLDPVDTVGYGRNPVAAASASAQITGSTWKEGGVGLPVVISCVFGCVLLLKRNYFASFFIAVFAAFFMTHEIIILYDNKAIELAQETLADGYFRACAEMFKDAVRSNGARFGIMGAILAAFFPMLAMYFDAWQKNVDTELKTNSSED